MATYATAEDVQDRYERPISDTARVEVLLLDVERDLRARVPDLADRVTAGVCSDEDVMLVVVRAALRVLRNPSGLRSEQTPDYSYNRDAGSIGTTGQSAFPDEDLALLGLFGKADIGPIAMGIPGWRRP